MALYAGPDSSGNVERILNLEQRGPWGEWRGGGVKLSDTATLTLGVPSAIRRSAVLLCLETVSLENHPVLGACPLQLPGVAGDRPYSGAVGAAGWRSPFEGTNPGWGRFLVLQMKDSLINLQNGIRSRDYMSESEEKRNRYH